MDTLHTVLRSIRSETKADTKSRRDHVSVFREFLDHLDRASRRRGAPPQQRAARPRAKRGRK